MSKVYINMTISGEVSASALAAFMGQVEQDTPFVSASAREPEPQTAAPKTRTAKPKVEPATEVAETSGEAEVQGKSAAGDDVAELPSAEDVTAAAKTYAAKNGRDALVSLLEKHGAKQVSGVAEDKRQAFIDEASA